MWSRQTHIPPLMASLCKEIKTLYPYLMERKCLFSTFFFFFQMIRKIFDDAYRSSMSCIVVDNIERLIDYGGRTIIKDYAASCVTLMSQDRVPPGINHHVMYYICQTY